MKNDTILVLANSGEPQLAKLNTLGLTLSIVAGDSIADFQQAADDATVILNWSSPRDVFRGVFKMCPNVAWVHIRSAGLDNALFPELIEFVEIRLPAFLRLERSFVEVRKIFTFLLGDANGEAVAVFLVVEDAIHGKQELVTLRAVPAFYHDEADLHSFVIEDDVLSVSNLFVLRPINIRATYVGNVRGKNDDRLNSHSEP